MIYTFYSFKGGVGRSMAMANVAFELAARGLRVLAIDFDLEAPGLERYFRVPLPTVHATPGVIDLIENYKRALSGSGGIGPEAEFRQLQRHLCPIAEFGGRGRLDLMPAGRRASEDDRRAYALAVRTFDWQDFYFNWEGEAFFEWLRRQLVGRDAEPGLYDVVLADSRTGVTEMGGVCACQLADVVVMLTAANHQNIEGTRELAQDLASPAVRTLRRQRPPLQIVVVPARVEQRAPELLPDFIARFDRAFGADRPAAFAELGLEFHELALPYVPEFAFEEQVTDRGSAERSALTEAFRRLADALLVLAGPSVPEELRHAAAESIKQRAGGQPQPKERAFDATQRFAGFDAYLSCSHAARPLVEGLAKTLAAPPYSLRTQFGDSAVFGSDRDLPATIAELLHHADALVLLADAGGVSPWQREELKLARSLPRTPRIVQVLLPGAPADAFEIAFGSTLRDRPLIDLRRGPDDREAVQVLVEALRVRGVAAATEPAVAEASERCPFPGAQPYTESDAGAFHGRVSEVARLLEVLRRQRRVVLQGPAGSGKTSLVLAGLWPALRAAGFVAGQVRIDLREATGTSWTDDAAKLGADDLLLIDHADEGSAADLAALGTLWARSDGPRLLLAWRSAPLAVAEDELLKAWRTAAPAVHDQREHPLHHAGPAGAWAALQAVLAGAAIVEHGALAGTALRATVESVLAQAGRRAETGLLDRLFADAGDEPGMAVVQRVLAALWPAQARGWLTNESYERLGGVDGVVCAALTEQRRAVTEGARAAFDALLQRLAEPVGEGGAWVARSMYWQRECTQPVLVAGAAALAQALARAGLLRVHADAEGTVLRLAHVPQRCEVLLADDAGRERATHMRAIAGAYAAWCRGERDAAAEAAILDMDLPALLPGLSLGEAGCATRVQRQKRRTRFVSRALGVTALALVLVAFATSALQSRKADAERLAAEQQAQQELAAQQAAAAAAREQVGRVQQAPAVAPPPTSGAAPPQPAARTRVVVHRSGSDAADAEQARRLAAALPADRFVVDERIEALPVEVCGDVRFHQPQDLEAAQAALDALNRALESRGDLRRLQLNDRSNLRDPPATKAGTIEVWLPPLTDLPVERQDRWGASRLVSAGCAVVGSDEKGRGALRRALGEPALEFYATEFPLRRVWLPAYYIGRHEVTMAQFAAYQAECERERVRACPPWRPRYVEAAKEPDRPAVFVSWAQAEAYCRWAGGRLPTELEWEKAARGVDGRFWPWGEQPEARRYQGKSQPLRQPVAVGSLPAGDSPYGVADLAGNVWEYTADWWQGEGSGHTIRGGSYLNTLMESRASVRWATGAEGTGAEYLGFRCVAEGRRLPDATPPPRR